MKEALPNCVSVRPMRHRSSSPRARAYRVYQKQKVRQQRLVLLGSALLLLMAVVIAAGWGLFHVAKPFIAQAVAPRETSQLEALLEKDFRLLNAPSLLYYNSLNTLPAGLQANRTAPNAFSGRLQPLLTAHEDQYLKAQLSSMLAQYPADRFVPYLYFYNPQDGTYVEINGYQPVAAASVIKLPILLDYLMHLDERDIATNTPLLYADFHRAGGAGDLQYKPTGVEFNANDVAGQMIRVSDNTCTNMMISYLGGTDRVNQRLAELGLVQTRIRNWLPDLAGTNTISPYEMATILYNLENGKLVSNAARENGIDILKSTHNRRLLVWPLPKEATVAHKTGDIGTALGDSGIVYLPNGRKYIMSMQVERPFNDYTARDMVQKASRMVYDYVAAQPLPENPLTDTVDASTLSRR